MRYRVTILDRRDSSADGGGFVKPVEIKHPTDRLVKRSQNQPRGRLFADNATDALIDTRL